MRTLFGFMFVYFISWAAFGQESIGVFENHVDLGNPNPPGAAYYDKTTGEYQITCGGPDGNDYHFAYREVSGDFTFQTHIQLEDLEGSNPLAHAAMMLDVSLERGSLYLDLVFTIQGELGVWWRSKLGTSASSYRPSLFIPMENGAWGKVERKGNTVNAYYLDQTTGGWQLFHSQIIDFPEKILVGLYTASRATGGVVLGRFTEVELRSISTSSTQNWELYR